MYIKKESIDDVPVISSRLKRFENNIRKILDETNNETN